MHKAGFVNIIGNPNVGKSTLMNALLGEQLSITTPKAQTTRHRITGLLNHDDYQVVFSDTPGIIQPAYSMQEGMMDAVNTTFDDADIFILMAEPEMKELKDPTFLERLKNIEIPLLVLINKIDMLDQEKLEGLVDFWKERLPKADILPISALHKFNTDRVLERILELLPESPPYYPKESLSDRNERFFVSEMVREAILNNYDKEIPYAVEVDVEEFKEAEDIIRIRANIFVERDTQKGIIIGHGGQMIRKTGTEARIKMEEFFKKKIFIDLFVKVRKDWRKDENLLKKWGYKR